MTGIAITAAALTASAASAGDAGGNAGKGGNGYVAGGGKGSHGVGGLTVTAPSPLPLDALPALPPHTLKVQFRPAASAIVIGAPEVTTPLLSNDHPSHPLTHHPPPHLPPLTPSSHLPLVIAAPEVTTHTHARTILLLTYHSSRLPPTPHTFSRATIPHTHPLIYHPSPTLSPPTHPHPPSSTLSSHTHPLSPDTHPPLTHPSPAHPLTYRCSKKTCV